MKKLENNGAAGQNNDLESENDTDPDQTPCDKRSSFL